VVACSRVSNDGAARSMINQTKEMVMSKKETTAQGSAAPVETPKKFRDMNWTQKIAYVCKAVTCVITFGFAFPNIFID
jgi:hypothetical protein